MAVRERAPGRRRSRGFTLLEMLVAFTILVMAFAVVLRVFASGARGSARAERYGEAVIQAQGLLERYAAQRPLRPLEQGGRLDSGADWSVVVEPADPSAEDLAAEPALALFRVTAAVQWESPGQEPRRVRLQTLRAVPDDGLGRL